MWKLGLYHLSLRECRKAQFEWKALVTKLVYFQGASPKRIWERCRSQGLRWVQSPVGENGSGDVSLPSEQAF